MRTARNKRTKKNNLNKKIKSFLIYSLIALIISGFVANFFLSNILEYSFALAKSGGVVDFKTDEKVGVGLISVNSLNEVKKLNILIFDKKNSGFYNFKIDLKTSLNYKGEDFTVGEMFKKINKDNSEISKILQLNFGMTFADVQVLSPSDFDDYLSIVSGEASFLSLPKLTNISEINLRDSYLMYSYSKSLDLKDKREISIKNLANFDSEIRDIFLDSVLGKEGLSITVVNATSVNGMGKISARKILNAGGRVVDITSSGSDEKDSLVIYKTKSTSVDYLSNYLGISRKISADEVGLKYPEIVKSDIIVVVGLDSK